MSATGSILDFHAVESGPSCSLFREVRLDRPGCPLERLTVPKPPSAPTTTHAHRSTTYASFTQLPPQPPQAIILLGTDMAAGILKNG